MKPTENTHHWDKLAAALRTNGTSDRRSEEMPFGFATRVVAQYTGFSPHSRLTLWERLSLRGATLAFVAAVAVSLWPQPRAATSAPIPVPSLELPTLAS
jgi:hypothetical protein